MERRNTQFRISNRLQRVEYPTGGPANSEGIQKSRTVRTGRVQGNPATHAAVRQIVNHRRNRGVHDRDQNPVGQSRNVADACRLYAGADERCRTFGMAGRSPGNGHGGESGLREKST